MVFTFYFFAFQMLIFITAELQIRLDGYEPSGNECYREELEYNHRFVAIFWKNGVAQNLSDGDLP